MKLRKIFCLFMTVITGIGLLNVEAMAAQNNSVTVGGSSSNFTNDWENTIVYYNTRSSKSKVAKMVYGYETDWWNEDYTWTYGYTCSTQASITNSKGTYSGSTKQSGRTSKIEVHHKSDGINVTYRIWMSKDSYYSEKKYNTNEK